MDNPKIKQAPNFSDIIDLEKQSEKKISDLRILIIHAKWNKKIIDNLLKGAISTLESMSVPKKNIFIHSVPGSYELPWACNAILDNRSQFLQIDAIIAVGVLIKGDTMHFEFIADAVSHHLMKVSIKHNKPVIFGVLTCLDESQALVRSGLDPDSPSNHNHAVDWAKAAVEGALNAKMLSTPKDVGLILKSVKDLNVVTD